MCLNTPPPPISLCSWGTPISSPQQDSAPKIPFFFPLKPTSPPPRLPKLGFYTPKNLIYFFFFMVGKQGGALRVPQFPPNRWGTKDAPRGDAVTRAKEKGGWVGGWVGGWWGGVTRGAGHAWAVWRWWEPVSLKDQPRPHLMRRLQSAAPGLLAAGAAAAPHSSVFLKGANMAMGRMR